MLPSNRASAWRKQSIQASMLFSFICVVSATHDRLLLDPPAPTLTPPGLDFWDGYGKSLGMILATETGDRTFFIAAIMAMAHSRVIVFTSAMIANIIMTLLSAALGFGLPALVPRKYTRWLSAVIFFYFGIKMLKEAWDERDQSGPSGELREAEEDIAHKLEEKSYNLTDGEDDDVAEGESTDEASQAEPEHSQVEQCFLVKGNTIGKSDEGEGQESVKLVGRGSTTGYSAIEDTTKSEDLVEAEEGEAKLAHEQSGKGKVMTAASTFSLVFSMTFFGEWGDRSQIATIALAAAQNIYGVILGAILGHTICTGAAVIGGRMVAAKVSKTMVNVCGGLLFVVFAVMTFVYEDD